MRMHLIRGVLALATALALAAPAAAQSTGMVKGKVVDEKGQPVQGAKILIEFAEGVTRKHETETKKNGEFIQIGLFPGNYRITATKEGVGKQTFEARVRIGSAAEVNFQLSPQSGLTEDDKKKTAALQGALATGESLLKEGKHDEAIAKFNEALAVLPNCHVCYYYIGAANGQKNQLAEAEAAFKKAIEVKPDFAEAYNGLAGVYNSQKKYAEAAAASEKAGELAGAGGGGGSASALYNQGVARWNDQKFPEATELFEKAVQADPNFADAHFQLGLAYAGTDKAKAVAAFEKFLSLVPTGAKADQAKAFAAALKQ